MSDVLAGRHPVKEALRRGTEIKRIYLAQGVKPAPILDEIRALAESAGVPIASESRRRMDGIASTSAHQGVVAIIASFEYARFSDVAHQDARLILLDGVTDPNNLGSILRSVEAFRWSGVLVPRHRSAEVTTSVRKVAAGAAEIVPVVQVGSPAESVLRLVRNGFRVLGVDPDGSFDYREAEYAAPLCIVLGAEGKGLGRLVRERCDALIRIPMRGTLGSINVAVSAAVVMSRSPDS